MYFSALLSFQVVFVGLLVNRTNKSSCKQAKIRKHRPGEDTTGKEMVLMKKEDTAMASCQKETQVDDHEKDEEEGNQNEEIVSPVRQMFSWQAEYSIWRPVSNCTLYGTQATVIYNINECECSNYKFVHFIKNSKNGQISHYEFLIGRKFAKVLVFGYFTHWTK